MMYRFPVFARPVPLTPGYGAFMPAYQQAPMVRGMLGDPAGLDPYVDPTSAPAPPPKRGKGGKGKGGRSGRRKLPVWVVPALVGAGVLVLGLGALALTRPKARRAPPMAAPAASLGQVTW